MARDIAETDAYVTSRRERKKVEMLFAHLKRILRLDRLRLRGPNGARDEFHLAAAAQNLRKLAKLLPNGPQIRTTWEAKALAGKSPPVIASLKADFFNSIRPLRTSSVSCRRVHSSAWTSPVPRQAPCA